ncbi:dTDP-4-dehydrorhamnose reductase [Bradyrhizobium sp. SZCCHNRI3037]|uniref:dTDP-4-dehydrorhamnose reductase n=1 Tax=Bradyrhizobium sp. SZCCHNRI3037 TaxID=3057290 RepID=UPI002915EF0C|nr:dTDP-4-dehydrorhamnose reductase [Bradyrhizobium sp. SZCCHNRI3037]
MNILLLGRFGQVGWELERSLSCLGEVTALGREDADLTNEDQIRAVVRSLRPSVVINAAAYTAVDQAELEPDLAFRVNAHAPGVLAEEVARLNGWLVHYSTDYAFDGTKPKPYDEQDRADPLSAYGRSKLAGEEAIRAAGAKFLIFRCSWIYASRRTNFALSILKQAIDGGELRVINDCFGSPTAAPLVADVTAHALRCILKDTDRTDLSGVYHLAASGVTNWFEYASFLIERAKDLGIPANPSQISAITEREFAALARRPLNSRFDTTKVRKAFGIDLPNWQCGVERFLHDVASALMLFPSIRELEKKQ